MQEHEYIRANEVDEIAEIDEIQGRRVSLKLSRFLVLTLIFCFLVSLTALWFSGTLLSAPDQLLPADFLQALACLLIPLGFLVPHLPWFNAASPTAPVTPAVISVMYNFKGPLTWTAHGPSLKSALLTIQDQAHFLFVRPYASVYFSPVSPVITPASTAEIALAGGLLLLCLFLMISALPMAVLAWKGEA